MKSVKVFFQLFVAFAILDAIVGIAGIFYGEAKVSFEYFLRSLIFLVVGLMGLLILKLLSKAKYFSFFITVIL